MEKGKARKGEGRSVMGTFRRVGVPRDTAGVGQNFTKSGTSPMSPPGNDLEKIRVPEARLLVTRAVEAQLNERQKRMILLLTQGEQLTSRRCEKDFGVTRETTAQDFRLLVKLGVAKREGKGRSTRYVYGAQT